jgi:hypothetical protein
MLCPPSRKILCGGAGSEKNFKNKEKKEQALSSHFMVYLFNNKTICYKNTPYPPRIIEQETLF